MKVIPTYIHGVLDYLVCSLLLLSPNLLGFTDVGGAAVTVPRLLGAAGILYSLVTRYELSVAKIVPMNVHLMLDMGSGALLAVSPWLFGFAGGPSYTWTPHVLIGASEVLIAMMSQTRVRPEVSYGTRV